MYLQCALLLLFGSFSCHGRPTSSIDEKPASAYGDGGGPSSNYGGPSIYGGSNSYYDEPSSWFYEMVQDEEPQSPGFSSLIYDTFRLMQDRVSMYSPAQHVGKIHRGVHHRPELIQPKDRLLGYNPDFRHPYPSEVFTHSPNSLYAKIVPHEIASNCTRLVHYRATLDHYMTDINCKGVSGYLSPEVCRAIARLPRDDWEKTYGAEAVSVCMCEALQQTHGMVSLVKDDRCLARISVEGLGEAAIINCTVVLGICGSTCVFVGFWSDGAGLVPCLKLCCKADETAAKIVFKPCPLCWGTKDLPPEPIP